MSKVRVVFNDEKLGYRDIECTDWQVNKKLYTLWLDELKDRAISIPVRNVLYVEDLY